MLVLKCGGCADIACAYWPTALGRYDLQMTAVGNDHGLLLLAGCGSSLRHSRQAATAAQPTPSNRCHPANWYSAKTPKFPQPLPAVPGPKSQEVLRRNGV